MTWLFGSSKKKALPISDPVPLASQSDISPSNTKNLAALRQERIAAGIPIIPKSKAPGRLIGGFNRFVEAFQRLNQPPARPAQNIYKAKHGSHHRHRHHRKDGSGPEKKASKHHHHREHRWQREERLKREAEEKARQGKHASSSSSPGLQAPKPVHVGRVKDPLPDMSPLSRQIRDLEGMLPSTHQGPGNRGRAVPEALNSSAGKGKQRAGEPAPCRLCSKRPEYRPGNGLCEKCMKLAFEPGRDSTEVRGGTAVEDLRLPFASPPARKPQPAGEFDPSDPTSVHPSYRAESQAYAYVKGQDGRRERDRSTRQNLDRDNDKGKGKYEPIAWRQKMGNEKAPEKKLPEYRTQTNGTSLLDKFTFHTPSPPAPLTPDNPARHTSAPRLSAAPSIWTDVKCTDFDYPPAPRRRRRSSTLPDAHNPTIAAATAAYNALHRFGAELKPASSRADDSDGDGDLGDVSHTGYTTIIDAYAREPTVTATATATPSRSTRNHPRSPPSPSVYPSVDPRARPPTTTGDIADAAPLLFDDRDARRNFDPLHPAFFDANPWFNAGERIPSPAPAPVRKDSKYVADRGRGTEKDKPAPRRGEGKDAGTGKESGKEIGKGTEKERGNSQGHYTDRHGTVRHLPPAHPPPIGPATTSKTNTSKAPPRDAPVAKPAGKPVGRAHGAPPAAYRGRDRGRGKERDAGGRVTDLGEFTGGRTGEGR